MSEETLYAVPFDLENLRAGGQRVPVQEEVAHGWWGAAQFDVSNDGTLAYVAGRATTLHKLDWVDREGNSEPLQRFEPCDFSWFSLSPKGDRVAYTRWDGEHHSMWIYDIGPQYSYQLPVTPAEAYTMEWSPSGESIFFNSFTSSSFGDIYWKRVDSSEPAEILTGADSAKYMEPTSWHPNGKHLLVHDYSGPKSFDFGIIEMEGDDPTGWRQLGDSQPAEFPGAWGDFSPDGNWVAYQSTQSSISRQNQIYVSPYPGSGRGSKINIEGNPECLRPKFSYATQELIFGVRETAGAQPSSLQMFIAKYRIEEGRFVFEGDPETWKGATTTWGKGPSDPFDVHPDGDRLLIRRPAEENAGVILDRVVLFENFFDYLRENVPVSQ